MEALEMLRECLWWISVAWNPRCTASVEYSRQCTRTDTRPILFGERLMDWVKACPDHSAAYEAWAAGPLKKIRTGR